jgi:hypothetical protein
MTDRDNIPTLPRPAPLPREEAPTPIPRRSSLEELRAGEDPYVAAIDELRVEVLRLSARLPELDARTSKTDLAQEARLSEHEMRLARIEAASRAAASDTSTLVHALTGKLSPKVLGAFVAVGTLVQILLQAYRQLHGGTP